MKARFNRERIRFDTRQADTLVVQGWFEGDQDGAEQFEAELDGRCVELSVQTQRGVEVTKKYLRYKTNVMVEYFLRVLLAGELAPGGFHALRLYHVDGDARTCIYHATARELAKLGRHLESWVEGLRELPDGRYQLRGWYMGCGRAQIGLLDGRGEELETECVIASRVDILGEFPEAAIEETRGFELTFAKPQENHLRLALKGNGKKALYVINCSFSFDRKISGAK